MNETSACDEFISDLGSDISYGILNHPIVGSDKHPNNVKSISVLINWAFIVTFLSEKCMGWS